MNNQTYYAEHVERIAGFSNAVWQDAYRLKALFYATVCLAEELPNDQHEALEHNEQIRALADIGMVLSEQLRDRIKTNGDAIERALEADDPVARLVEQGEKYERIAKLIRDHSTPVDTGEEPPQPHEANSTIAGERR